MVTESLFGYAKEFCRVDCPEYISKSTNSYALKLFHIQLFCTQDPIKQQRWTHPATNHVTSEGEPEL